MDGDSTTTLPVWPAPEGGRLSAQMLEDYQRTGVLVLEDFVAPAACDALRRRAAELVDGFDPGSAQSVFSTTEQTQHDDRYFIESGDKIRYFFERDAWNDNGELQAPTIDCLNKIGHAMHDLDPEFDAFSRTPELRELVNGLGIRDPGIIQSMYIFKPPRIGGEVVCHQDSTYLYTEPESCIGFWFALEDATLQNGCMYFIPGVHHEPLRERNRRNAEGTRTQNETLDPAPLPEHLKVPAPVPKGSLVVFSGRTPHLSGPNLSERSRHAYTVHVIDRSCHYPADNWLQRGPDLPLRGFDHRVNRP